MPNRAELIIRITAEGKCEVSGPINDKFVCYAMLESARDAIKEFNDDRAKQQKIEIVRAPGVTENGIAFTAEIGRAG